MKAIASFGETCTQYLFLDESCYDKPNFEGAKYVFTPPLVPQENIEPLWKGLKLGYLQEVSTDHCPFNFKGQKDLGRGDFRKIPNGGPGVEDRLSMVYHGGVIEARLQPEQVGRYLLHRQRKNVRHVPKERHDRRRLRCGHCHLRSATTSGRSAPKRIT